MTYEIIATEEFIKWQSKLKDRQAAKAIATRLVRAEVGLLGDVEPVGGGISEMRIFVGKGYRVYFTIKDGKVIILLCGGNKSNKKQQQQDIARAKEIFMAMAEED